MKLNDDSDVKIFGQEKKKDGFDPISLIEEVKKHRFNGNAAKAKTIGSHLAVAFVLNAAKEELVSLAESLDVVLTDKVIYQIKALSVFSAEYCLNNYLPSALLSSVAINELYESLIEDASDFYERLTDGTAFSFYYLGVRRGGSIDDSIGDAFAMLCGDEENQKLKKFGKILHQINVETYKKAIESFSFTE